MKGIKAEKLFVDGARAGAVLVGKFSMSVVNTFVHQVASLLESTFNAWSDNLALAAETLASWCPPWQHLVGHLLKVWHGTSC